MNGIRFTVEWRGLAPVINAANGDIFAKRVELCRRGMGTDFCCHPANRVQRINRAPHFIPSSLIKAQP